MAINELKQTLISESGISVDLSTGDIINEIVKKTLAGKESDKNYKLMFDNTVDYFSKEAVFLERVESYKLTLISIQRILSSDAYGNLLQLTVNETTIGVNGVSEVVDNSKYICLAIFDIEFGKHLADKAINYSVELNIDLPDYVNDFIEKINSTQKLLSNE